MLLQATVQHVRYAARWRDFYFNSTVRFCVRPRSPWAFPIIRLGVISSSYGTWFGHRYVINYIRNISIRNIIGSVFTVVIIMTVKYCTLSSSALPSSKDDRFLRNHVQTCASFSIIHLESHPVIRSRTAWFLQQKSTSFYLLHRSSKTAGYKPEAFHFFFAWLAKTS